MKKFKVSYSYSLKHRLEKYFEIEESRFYKCENNEWNSVIGGDEPDSPHDGVSIFLLSKK